MAPVEIYIDGKFSGSSSTGLSQIKLPKLPESEITWYGDERGSGVISMGETSEPEFFELTELDQEAEFEVANDLSAALFPNAENSKKIRIVVKRV